MRRLRQLAEPYYDRWKLMHLRRQLGTRLYMASPECAHFWVISLRMAADARLRIGPELITERRPGNHVWLHPGAELELGERVWLRTEHGENQLTAFPGARISVGSHSLLNGAMLHAKASITIGRDARLAFGVRVFDADLHDLDCQTPERIEPVRIGDRVWLGANVIVLRGVTIGDDVVVGAGSVVTHDLPSGVLAVGSPARVVRPLASRVGCR